MIYYHMGTTQNNCRDYKEALESYHSALDIRIKIHGNKPHPHVITAYNAIGLVFNNLKQYDKALESFAKALKLCE